MGGVVLGLSWVEPGCVRLGGVGWAMNVVVCGRTEWSGVAAGQIGLSWGQLGWGEVQLTVG
jgi:hypothetical protein